MDDENYVDEVDAAVTAGSDKAKNEKQHSAEKKPSIEPEKKAVPAEVKLTKREMDSTLDALNKSKSQITEATEKLGSQIANLRDESIILNEVPEKLARQLRGAIPEISKEIKIQCLKDLDDGVKSCYKNLVILDDMAEAAVDKINSLKSFELKKTLIQMAGVIIISVLSASASTYFMMRKFPPFVEINMTRDVQIENSKVNVFSQKDPVVSKALEKVLPEKFKK